MAEYTPDSWVVIKMTHKDQIIYKVLGGWSGSYVDGSSWRLNSGITKAEYDISNDVWRFHGSSGSVYIVDPDNYGVRMATADIWNTMKTTYPDNVELLDNQDWSKFDFGVSI